MISELMNPSKILKREEPVLVDIDTEKPGEAIREELAKQALEVLGYRIPMRTQIQSHEEAELRNSLSELKIKPFTADSVARYMRLAALKVRFFGPVGFDNTFPPMVMALTVVLLLQILIRVFSRQVAHMQPSEWIMIPIGILIGGFSFLGFRALMNRVIWWTSDMATDGQRWGAYQEKIPDDVIRLALIVKRALPAASFSIDWLRNFAVEPDRSFDPFLVVHLGSAVRYIAVWDENYVPEHE